MKSFAYSFGLALCMALPALAQETVQQTSGVVSARHHLILSAARAGVLTDQFVLAGQTVEKDQVIGRFDCSIEDAALAVIEIEVEQAKTQLKLQRSLAARGAAGRVDVLSASQEVQLREAHLALDQAKAQSCVIKAPFSGVIADWKIPAFSNLQRGEPVVEIVDSTALFIELIVPVQWAGLIWQGQSVRFVSDYLGQEFTAKIDLIAPAADAVSQTIKITAALETTAELPKVGTSGIVQFSQNQ